MSGGAPGQKSLASFTNKKKSKANNIGANKRQSRPNITNPGNGFQMKMMQTDATTQNSGDDEEEMGYMRHKAIETKLKGYHLQQQVAQLKKRKAQRN